MELTTRPSNEPLGKPLGGINGNWRYRIPHFHVPLALTSLVIVVLWITLPLFQTAGHQGPPSGMAGVHQQSQAGSQMASHQPPQTGGQTAGHQPPQPGGANPPMNSGGGQIGNVVDVQDRLLIGRFTTATGYVALVLLALTLLIGPANLLLRRRTPISSYLTRDVGMWAAIVSVIHVIAGFFVHGPGEISLGERILRYFFAPNGGLLTNTFGLANWTGLVATVIVIGLLAISNDFSLRNLKARTWKNLQRLNYALFLLVILHAIYYGALNRVTSPSTILLGLCVSVVFIGQMVGIRLWRRRHARFTAKQSVS